jgi:bud site selection protein 20
MHKNNKEISKKYKTKRRTKDIDQVHDDLKPDNAAKLLSQRDPDLPGSGSHYCLTCARHFVSDATLQEHFRTKSHKRRLKALKEPIYTQEEAEKAAGMGNYVLQPPPPESKSLIDDLSSRRDLEDDVIL